METLRFVDNSSWKLIRKQHGNMNWSVHIAFTIGCFPLRWLLASLLLRDLKSLCIRYSRKKWRSRPTHRQEFNDTLQECLHLQPKFVSDLKRLMPPEEKLPEAVLRLRGEIGVPHDHPAFCVIPEGVSALYLSTAFSSLEECRVFLRHLMTLRMPATLIESASIRSLCDHTTIEMPERLASGLNEEEMTKLLHFHHPTFHMADQIFETRRLSRIIDLAPKPQLVIVLLWALFCLGCAISGWSVWSNHLKIPSVVCLLAVGIEYAAMVASLIIQVKQRLVFTTNKY